MGRTDLALGFWLLAILPGICAAAPDRDPSTLTLNEAVVLGLERNVDIVLAEQNLAQMNSRYREIVGMGLPELSASGVYTRNYKEPLAFTNGTKMRMGDLNGMTATVDVEQILYAGGSVRAGRQAALAGVAATTESLRAAQDETVFAVKRLFWRIVLASATVSIQQDTVASAEDHLQTTRTRFKEGLESDLAVLRQEVEVAGTKPLLIRARNLLEVGLTRLKNTLKMDVDHPLSISGDLSFPTDPLPPYERLVQCAMDHDATLQAARRRALSAQHNVDVVRGYARPSLSLFGRYQWQAQSPDFSPTVDEKGESLAAGLRAYAPLYMGGSNLERIRQAEIEYQKSVELVDQAERNVRVALKTDYLDAQEARERAESQNTAIAQARRALTAMEMRYGAGQASQLDLNDATLSLQRARLAHVLALSDYWTGVAAVEKTTGQHFKEIVP
ncbi:MAG: TolC family protein [Elusimicrobia bacterium]|nr:TolC family protein [Elusimicrobiota bacterium]MBP9699063.1 TolC family protein [Elusimicrobiota bacterium]